jgi:hypothetical protein
VGRLAFAGNGVTVPSAARTVATLRGKKNDRERVSDYHETKIFPAPLALALFGRNCSWTRQDNDVSVSQRVCRESPPCRAGMHVRHHGQGMVFQQ